MSTVTRYRGKEIVPMTSTASNESCCEAKSEPVLHFPYFCTREPGHGGDHEAGGPTDMRLASWPQD